MTFDEFVATRKVSIDLAHDLPDEAFEFEGQEGRIYCGDLFLWDRKDRPGGRWATVIGNQEHLSDDIAEIERRLYQYALWEGIIPGERLR
jgi:hypothetical protein